MTTLLRCFITLVALVLTSACARSPNDPTSPGGVEPPPQNISAETLPATHSLSGGTVTLISATVSTMIGPGRVFQFEMKADPFAVSSLRKELVGSQGEVLRIESSTPGSVTILGTTVLVAMLVTAPDGGSTRFDFVH